MYVVMCAFNPSVTKLQDNAELRKQAEYVWSQYPERIPDTKSSKGYEDDPDYGWIDWIARCDRLNRDAFNAVCDIYAEAATVDQIYAAVIKKRDFINRLKNRTGPALRYEALMIIGRDLLQQWLDGLAVIQEDGSRVWRDNLVCIAECVFDRCYELPVEWWQDQLDLNPVE